MNIVITGSNGIIGRQLLSELLISYPDAFFFILNRRNIPGTDSERIRSIEIDLLTAEEHAIESLMQRIRPAFLFHLAWDTGHADYLSTPNNTAWEQRSILLINSFYSNGGKKFIGMGSSIEYDWSFPPPFNTKLSPVNRNGFLYGASKLNVARHLESLTGISYLWARIFFVFGPGQGASRLVPLIINNILGNAAPLAIHPALQRDYLSTFEIARQIRMMHETDYSGAVNICSGRSTYITGIVEMIESIMQKKATFSDKLFADKFDNPTLYGDTSIINKYYNGYEYSEQMFLLDMRATVAYYTQTTESSFVKKKTDESR